MNREDIIKLAQDAEFPAANYPSLVSDRDWEALERFADLVRADEREKYKWDIHSCGPTCKRYACVAMREAVEAEREACAKVCETEWSNVAERMYGEECAAAIRARGQA